MASELPLRRQSTAFGLQPGFHWRTIAQHDFCFCYGACRRFHHEKGFSLPFPYLLGVLLSVNAFIASHWKITSFSPPREIRPQTFATRRLPFEVFGSRLGAALYYQVSCRGASRASAFQPSVARVRHGTLLPFCCRRDTGRSRGVYSCLVSRLLYSTKTLPLRPHSSLSSVGGRKQENTMPRAWFGDT